MMSRNVIAAVDDLFFASRIRAVAEHLNISIRFAKSAEDALKSAKTERPDLIIVDLNSRRCEPLELAKRLKSDEQLRSLALLGFFSHVQTELKQQALQAGYDELLPRSIFSQKLSEILLGD
jgi:PleD family two-component response regulator